MPLPHAEPPHPQGTHGRLSPVTTSLPPTTSRLPLAFPEPLPSRAAPSRHSSGAGSTAPQRRALKPCHQVSAGGVPEAVLCLGRGHVAPIPLPSQEQRMVSPETDSGFIGSESSRVSLLARTPEHRPLSSGYSTSTVGLLRAMGHWGGRGSGWCGWELGAASLTHSFPRMRGVLEHPVPAPVHPQKKEAPLLPPRKALRGPYPTPGHGPPPGNSMPPSTPSPSSSPVRWAGSQGSELGPEGDGGECLAPSCACASRCPTDRPISAPQLALTQKEETGAAPVGTPPVGHPPHHPQLWLTATCWDPVWSESECPQPCRHGMWGGGGSLRVQVSLVAVGCPFAGGLTGNSGSWRELRLPNS